MSIEVGSNPFRPDGELSKEAEIIIKNSTILRDKVIINDPSLKSPENGNLISAENLSRSESSPDGNGGVHNYEGSPIRTGEVVSAKVSSPLSQTAADSVDAEPQPLQVEHVKIKSGPTKCCLIL